MYAKCIVDPINTHTTCLVLSQTCTSYSMQAQPAHHCVIQHTKQLPSLRTFELVRGCCQLPSCHAAVQVVGSHELSSEAKDKALKRREHRAAAELKISASERQEAQQQKRQEKQLEQAVSCSCCANACHAVFIGVAQKYHCVIMSPSFHHTDIMCLWSSAHLCLVCFSRKLSLCQQLCKHRKEAYGFTLQEKVKRMNPEQRAKYEARQERVQTKRAMKSRMIRI